MTAQYFEIYKGSFLQKLLWIEGASQTARYLEIPVKSRNHATEVCKKYKAKIIN